MTDFFNAILIAIALVFVTLFGATAAVYEPNDTVAGLWPDCPTGEGNLNNATLVIPADSVNQELFAGSLVGAFTPDGDCIGVTYFHGNANQNLVIRGADPDSPDPRGAEVGESFELRVLNEVVPNVTTTEPLVYAHDALYIIRSGEYPTSSDATARIQELEDQVDALTTERDALQTNVDNLTSERDALQTSVDNLTSERDALQSQLTDAESTITTLSDRIDQAVSILTGGS